MTPNRILAIVLLASANLALPAAAQADAPVVAAPKILDALGAKDIVLDQPGRPARRYAIDLQVQFGFDSAQLEPQGQRQLDQLALALNDKSLELSQFELAGHTDRVGTAQYNINLSRDRAEAVKAYLAEVHGVPAARLRAIGYGFARLADPANPASALNRRVEVRRIAASAPARPESGRLVPTPR